LTFQPPTDKLLGPRLRKVNMKISLEWLRQYVDFIGSPEKLADLLTNVGFPVEEIAPAGDDWMLDVEVTSNRPDCLGHIGIAREVAAVTGAELCIPDVTYAESGNKVDDCTSVQNEIPEFCRRYTARLIDGIVVGPAPDWMRRRLETIGQRSINNVVDITNYVLMEIGQPLHTFDLDLLADKRIAIRLAAGGEQMETIDHSKIKLTDEMLVIADASRPVALAGVMGGADSEVTEKTKSLLLESAWFDPLSVRSASRSLKIASESSFRFERNVSEVGVDWASRRAAALLIELASGTVAPGVIDSWPAPPQTRKQTLRLSRLRQTVGIDLDPNQVINILQRLGFAPDATDKDTLECTVPDWRSGDIDQEAAMIEEVIRIHGYDHIPTENQINITVKRTDTFQRTRGKVLTTLVGAGFHETVNVGFIEDKFQDLFAEQGSIPLRVEDQSRNVNALRHHLLPSLLNVRKVNRDVGNGRCDLFELAAVHERADAEGTPRETQVLGLLSDGSLRELRGVLDAIVTGLDTNTVLQFTPSDNPWSENGAGVRITLGDQILGVAGLVSSQVFAIYDLDVKVVGAQLDFSLLMNMEENATNSLKPLARFPGITRDLSLVLDDTIHWSAIEQAVNEHAIPELREVAFVDIYRGKGIDPGKKSLTLSMQFRRDEETLTHEQADQWQSQVLATLTSKFQATLRT